MREYKITETINAPAEKIWAILTDAPNFPNWNKGVTKIEGKIALGEKITVHTTYSEQSFPVKVTELTPNHSMIWTGGMPLGLFKGVRTYKLSQNADGTTTFYMHEVFSGILLPLIGRSIPDLNPSFQDYAAGLKQKAES